VYRASAGPPAEDCEFGACYLSDFAWQGAAISRFNAATIRVRSLCGAMKASRSAASHD